MSIKRLRSRVPSAKNVGTGMLASHQLRFHKKSKDGSAKCDIVETANETDRVYGVLHEIAAGEKAALDLAEGLGHGYAEKMIRVQVGKHKIIRPFTYFATAIDESLKPYSWYLEHVLIGAKEAGVPAEYLRRLNNIETIADPDPVRAERELSIYR